MVFGDRLNADPLEESVEAAEGAATVEVGRHLFRYVSLANETYNLLNVVTSAIAAATVHEMSLARRITMSLLVRLANDLRSITRLALSGYPIQAAALAASAYEIACAVVLIGTDEARARQWVAHKNPQRLPEFLGDLQKATVEMLATIGMQGEQLTEQADTAYITYSQFCMAKHGNPLLQKELGAVHRGDQVFCVPGPIPIREAERVTAYVLKKTVAIACWAIASSHVRYVPSEENAAVRDGLGNVARRYRELEALTKPGWDRDPYGKWTTPSSPKKPRKPKS
jgi:hypothetical protein